ncbi:hypothetical protein ACA910_012242 [Epithemia clementina (nom. ined.)]
MYVTAWQQLSTTTSTSPNTTTTTTTKPRIWFLEDTNCARVIRRVEPKLVPFFEMEPIGKYCGDVCRAAALYLLGGYYFDIDMKAIQPYVPSSLAITFDMAMAESQELHFNSIMVAAPRHPILYWSLQIMLQLYQQEQGAKPRAAKKEDSILQQQQQENEQQSQCNESTRDNTVILETSNSNSTEKKNNSNDNDDDDNDVPELQQIMFQQRQQAWQDPAFVQQAQHAVQSMARQSWITADIGTYALKASFDYYQEKSNQWRDRI